MIADSERGWRPGKTALPRPSPCSAASGMLVNERSLPDNNQDHALKGEWAGYRECHVKPDLLLIYGKPAGVTTLRLARFGSHSELFR
jgi:mRNA interferase YafQ